VFKAGVAVALLAAAAVHAEEPLRDPMQPFRPVPGATAAAGVAAPRYRLTGVLISPERRIAMVNGRPYQKGERVADAEITSIELQTVHLREGDRDVVLHLGSAGSRSVLSRGDTEP
jgi:hypothetical protein